MSDHWCRFILQADDLACFLAPLSAGIKIDINSAIMAITTSNSTKVKALDLAMAGPLTGRQYSPFTIKHAQAAPSRCARQAFCSPNLKIRLFNQHPATLTLIISQVGILCKEECADSCENCINRGFFSQWPGYWADKEVKNSKEVAPMGFCPLTIYIKPC